VFEGFLKRRDPLWSFAFGLTPFIFHLEVSVGVVPAVSEGGVVGGERCLIEIFEVSIGPCKFLVKRFRVFFFFYVVEILVRLCEIDVLLGEAELLDLDLDDQVLDELLKIERSCELLQQERQVELRVRLAQPDQSLDHGFLSALLVTGWKLPFVGVVVLVDPEHDLIALEDADHALADLEAAVLLLKLMRNDGEIPEHGENLDEKMLSPDEILEIGGGRLYEEVKMRGRIIDNDQLGRVRDGVYGPLYV
jgi:hypothetical protein